MREYIGLCDASSHTTHEIKAIKFLCIYNIFRRIDERVINIGDESWVCASVKEGEREGGGDNLAHINNVYSKF